jgi:hypothetical protein
MTKKVYLFGAYSLDRARQYVRDHQTRDLVLLKAPDRRFAVCLSSTASELKAEGYTPVDLKE